MKRPIAVFFSLILILVLISTAPAVAFAENSFTIDEADRKEPLTSTELLEDARAIKVPGPTTIVPGGAKASVEKVTATNFHDSSLPDSGWIAIDSDGDGWNWMYAKDFSDNFFSLDGRDGECLTSASYVNALGALNPDNWLVSPAITVPQGKQLDFLVSGQDPKVFSEHYGVYVSTTSQTDLSTFTEVYLDTVSHGGGVYEGHFIDLRSYAGQTVYIAFRHYNCTDMYWLNLDGLSVTDYTGQAPDAPGSEPTIIRLKGKDRYATSIVIAQELAGQGTDKFPGAIIATGDSFPDALAGSALSTADDAPILLISSRVPSTIDNAISFISDHVDPNGKVYILGGTGVVPETVERRVKDLGYQGDYIIRFAGQDRYETNLKVLALLRQMNGGQLESILVCDGTNWPDAATASATGLPILLVPKAGLNDAQKSLLATLNQPIIDVIGGPGAVS
ncbi:MAG: cell wall-binding repeat-containing protein, partial [Anaerovoracaceae bacterium]|nr:cell wall-binding repeat-containing protein [Anaerovoracaceae bacterium]